mgnify:FL=1
MDRLDRKSRDSFLDRGILRILRARSTERDETEKREPHKITSPFLLESPHTHQTPEETKKAPATFLTCATEKKEGTEGELMGIKFEKKGKKGDQRVWIICPCKNPTETDNQRKAYAQEIVKGEKPTIPPGDHLVNVRVVFLNPDTQPADKDLFLLQTTHPSINEDSPDKLKESVAQALKTIKDAMQMQEEYHTTEANNAFYNQFLASAPPLEEEQTNPEQEATGGKTKVKKEPNLPINSGEKIPGAKDDQSIWTPPTIPPQLIKKVDTSKHMIIIHKSDISRNKQPIKQLAKEYFEEMGLGNLTYPSQSQENAGGARSEDIWGYLLRHDQEKEEGAQKEKKNVTYAAWIKKEVKDKWLDKAYDTMNLTDDLKITLLTSDINRNPVFNDIKHHFAVWEDNVMTYLYTAWQKKKKNKKKKKNHSQRLQSQK